MNIKEGHRYQITFPDGRQVSGLCEKINDISVIIRSPRESRLIPSDELKTLQIEHL
jgi:hypothetical protein